MANRNQTPVFVAVDWGTTNLRAYLVGRNGRCLSSVSSDEGLLSVNGDYCEVLEKHIGSWLETCGALPVLMSGMVGSRTGWREVPYITGALTAEKLASSLYRIEDFNSGNAWIIPGATATSSCRQPDVMRGEEIQIVGAQVLGESCKLPQPDFFCLPGTHNKWVFLSDGEVNSFSTTMTGELYNLLSGQSILSQSVDKEADWDDDAFVEGLEVSHHNGGILHQLFSVRSRQLFGEHGLAQGAAYLSGLLIGSEIRSMLNIDQRRPVMCETNMIEKKPLVTVIASSDLMNNYLTALHFYGIEANGISSSQATLSGMLEVAQKVNLNIGEKCL